MHWRSAPEAPEPPTPSQVVMLVDLVRHPEARHQELLAPWSGRLVASDAVIRAKPPPSALWHTRHDAGGE